MKNIIFKLSLLTCIIFMNNVLAQNPTSVPISHPIYAYLERMETLGYVQNLLDGIRPYSRAKVAEVLLKLDLQRDQLTPIDREKLDNFLLDFRYEIQPDKKNALVPEGQNWYSIFASVSNFKSDVYRFFKRKHPEEENHVVLWEKNGNSFYMDYEQGLDYETRSDNKYRSASWQNYQFRGTIAENFGYQWQVSLQGLRGNDDNYVAEHPILKGSWSQQKEDEDGIFSPD